LYILQLPVIAYLVILFEGPRLDSAQTALFLLLLTGMALAVAKATNHLPNRAPKMREAPSCGRSLS
jgi:hypothetical protein